MSKKLKIINIDGTDGVGKTTQINMLHIWLKKQDIPCKTLYLEDNAESAREALKETRDFLNSVSDSVVICDGSIARMMVLDMLNNIPQRNIVENYKDILHDYEVISHKYGVFNLLMVMDNTYECGDRISKREKLLGNINKGIKNHELEKEVINLLRNFNNYTISKSLIFNVFEIEERDSILEVHDRIIKYLQDNFEIKKPS